MTSLTHTPRPTDVVKAFLGCVKLKDLETMRKLIHPDAIACLIRENEPRFQTLAEAIETLGKAKGELVETCWNEIEQTNGEYATVWASFSIHWDGKASNYFGCFRSIGPANVSSSFIKPGRAHSHVGEARC